MPDLERHELAALLQKVFISGDGAVQHRLGQAMRSQIGAHLDCIGDSAVLLFATVALLGQLLEVPFGRFVADGDVDLALSQHEIGDLVVLQLAAPELGSECHAQHRCRSDRRYRRLCL